MIARPAITALGCRTCRGAIYRAVFSSSVPSFRSLPPPYSGLSHLQGPARRPFSSEQAPTDTSILKETSRAEKDKESVEDVENDVLQDTPWFLEVDPPRHVPDHHKPDLPRVPEDAPALLEPMLNYVYEDMGLDDLALLDLRDIDPPAALGPNLIMLLGTARSERHLHVSSGRLVRWLRKNHKVSANTDGLIGPGELRTKLRRLRKKAKLMGTNTAIVPGGDNGISTGWVCVNFSTHGNNQGEAVSFDEGGRFSGFGTAPSGTTIVVQCLTESRRLDLDLETLWKGMLRRSLEQTKRINGENLGNKEELNALVASKVQLPKPTNSPASQWQAMKDASQRHRYFSTMARRLSPQSHTAKPPSSPTSNGSNAALKLSLNSLQQCRQHLQDLQVAGLLLRDEELPDLISAVLRAPAPEDSAAERLALLDELLQTAEERRISIYSNGILTVLIESMIASPDYGPELQRAQHNLEVLLKELAEAPEPHIISQLLNAYAKCQNWERFWDVFRTPPRFMQPRISEHYEIVYTAMAATKDRKMCADALRWVYPEMTKEEPPVKPVGKLYDSLRACILVADPEAKRLVDAPDWSSRLSRLEKNRLNQREFVNMLREAKQGRMHAVAEQARVERHDIPLGRVG